MALIKGNFGNKGASRSGRPKVENINKIIRIVESERYVNTVWISQELSIVQKTVCNHFNKAECKKKLVLQVPHELTQKNRTGPWTELPSTNRRKIDPFLKQMVTGDEKWVTYDNVKLWSNNGKPPQTLANPGLSVGEVLLCI